MTYSDIIETVRVTLETTPFTLATTAIIITSSIAPSMIKRAQPITITSCAIRKIVSYIRVRKKLNIAIITHCQRYFKLNL